jgi:hypothetical protein
MNDGRTFWIFAFHVCLEERTLTARIMRPAEMTVPVGLGFMVESGKQSLAAWWCDGVGGPRMVGGGGCGVDEGCCVKDGWVIGVGEVRWVVGWDGMVRGGCGRLRWRWGGLWWKGLFGRLELKMKMKRVA